MIDWNQIRSYFRASRYKCIYCGSKNTYPIKTTNNNQLYTYDSYNGQEKLWCHCKSCNKNFGYPIGRTKRNKNTKKSIDYTQMDLNEIADLLYKKYHP